MGGESRQIIKNLVSEKWQVYYAYNSNNEELLAEWMFGTGVKYMNRLVFSEDGRFELSLNTYTNE
jgi:hypothetical protein